MCGRYTLSKGEAEIVLRFKVDETFSQTRLSFNIAPTMEVPVVYAEGGKRLMQACRWGLIPSWAKDWPKGKPVINARAETLFEKPYFRKSVNSRRCLIPADGFYEWRGQGKGKQPVHIHLKDMELFAFAGLWDSWTSPDGEVLPTVAIVTTSANDLVLPVHERMPVIVRPEFEEMWLSPKISGPLALAPVFEPYDPSQMQMYEVGDSVNRARNDGPELIAPLEAKYKKN